MGELASPRCIRRSAARDFVGDVLIWLGQDGAALRKGLGGARACGREGACDLRLYNLEINVSMVDAELAAELTDRNEQAIVVSERIDPKAWALRKLLYRFRRLF